MSPGGRAARLPGFFFGLPIDFYPNNRNIQVPCARGDAVLEASGSAAQTGGFGWRYARTAPVVLEKSGTGAASRAQASHACSRAIPGARPGGTMTALRGARWTGTGCRSPRPRKRGPELVRSTLRQKWPPVERRKAWCPDRKGCRRVWSHTCGSYQGAFRRSASPHGSRGEKRVPARPRRK
jgi:hypothetical protein